MIVGNEVYTLDSTPNERIEAETLEGCELVENGEKYCHFASLFCFFLPFITFQPHPKG